MHFASKEVHYNIFKTKILQCAKWSSAMCWKCAAIVTLPSSLLIVQEYCMQSESSYPTITTDYS